MSVNNGYGGGYGDGYGGGYGCGYDGRLRLRRTATVDG